MQTLIKKGRVIDPSQNLDTIADVLITNNKIETSTKLVSPRLENTLGDIAFVDLRGAANLTELGEAALTTDKQSIFQKEFEQHYDSRGGIYILARKLEDVTEVI